VAEYRFHAADGRERWIHDEASIVPPQERGGYPLLRGVMYDVTEEHSAEHRMREALEREQAASVHLRDLDEIKTGILTAVSHEMRTPLTSVLGMSQTLRDHAADIDPAARSEFIERIGANAERLSRLISDLLDLDRLARGIVQPTREATDPARIVRTVIEALHIPLARLHIQVPPAIVSVDGVQFERILSSLLENAVRYAPPEAPIWVRVTTSDDEREITVEDAGPGVPDSLKRSVFEPFTRGSEVITHAPGVGIGLALVSRFADVHGGRAWVEDRQGGGASFRVVLGLRDRALAEAPA
jgi:two-component system sensor histidine kinase KdpD